MFRYCERRSLTYACVHFLFFKLLIFFYLRYIFQTFFINAIAISDLFGISNIIDLLFIFFMDIFLYY